MYLINTTSLKLESFPDERGLRYAILSHRWESEEVLFKDMLDETRRPEIEKLNGYDKILQCCRLAKESDLDYAWVDTCCIDKGSSADLQEAINSMFRWYQGAVVCFAHLADVDDEVTIESIGSSDTKFRRSKWFRRGWTLQELVAPRSLILFSRSWSEIGTRVQLAEVIHEITGIRKDILETGFDPDNRPVVAEIMSWARGRETRRVEDRAYSLIGLFDINMPMLYGEGSKAFKRLQEEIMKSTSDQSLFAWSGLKTGHKGLFAPSPDNFPAASLQFGLEEAFSSRRRRWQPDTIYNQGLSLTMDLLAFRPCIFIAIVCYRRDESGDEKFVGIYLQAINNRDCYTRVSYRGNDLAEVPLSSTEKLLWDRPVNVVYRFDQWESKIADRNVIPYQCAMIGEGLSLDLPESSIRLLGEFDPSNQVIAIQDGNVGTFCNILRDVNASKLKNGKNGLVKLGFDCRYLPFCIFLFNPATPKEVYRTEESMLYQRSDKLTPWRGSVGESPNAQMAVVGLDNYTSEYLLTQKLLLVHAKSRMYGAYMGEIEEGELLNVKVQFGNKPNAVICHVSVTVSHETGWTFHVTYLTDS